MITMIIFDFGNNIVEVIITHFKNIRENSNVKIDDAVIEWDIIKSNFYGIRPT